MLGRMLIRVLVRVLRRVLIRVLGRVLRRVLRRVIIRGVGHRRYLWRGRVLWRCPCVPLQTTEPPS